MKENSGVGTYNIFGIIPSLCVLPRRLFFFSFRLLVSFVFLYIMIQLVALQVCFDSSWVESLFDRILVFL